MGINFHLFKKHFFIDKTQKYIMKILHWLFVLSGGQFYLNWILPTNPSSKNPLINLIYGGRQHCWYGDYKVRLKACFMYGIIHIIGAILYFFINEFWTICNLAINIYPIIVQVYIGIRCYRIIILKKDMKILYAKQNVIVVLLVSWGGNILLFSSKILCIFSSSI